MTKPKGKTFCFFLGIICLLFFFTASSHAGVVQGKVTSIKGDMIELDIGSEKGVKVGDTGRIYYIITIGEKNKTKSIKIAKVKITHISQNSSIARIEGELQGKVQVGYLVEVQVQAAAAKPPPQKVMKETHQLGEIWRDPHLGMEFVWVPGGCFEMGYGFWRSDYADDEKPVHTVCVDGFWMGRYEVTQGQWQRLMGDNPSHFKDCGDNCPVERLSWDEAVDFARRLSQRAGYTFRLPTEAEWEYACRSGGRRENYSGEDNIDAVAWYDGNASGRTHPVGQKRSNGLGIFDMSGNVSEWCQDRYDATYYSRSPRNNPQGPSSGVYRVKRGGSWLWDNQVEHCDHRDVGRLDQSSNEGGFRLVRVGR